MTPLIQILSEGDKLMELEIDEEFGSISRLMRVASTVVNVLWVCCPTPQWIEHKMRVRSTHLVEGCKLLKKHP